MTHAIVIGGSKGLGRVVARLMAARGDSVSVISRSEIPVEDRAAGRIESFKADITRPAEVEAALQAAAAAHGPVNYCVFLQRFRGKENDWAGELETTLSATRRCVDFLEPMFSAGGDNAIVMVSSVFARYVGEGQALSYHVAKAGLEQMVRFYAVKLGPRRIRSNGITPFTFLKQESKAFYLDNAALTKLYQDIIPAGRMGTTEDSANAIGFLCSPQASFINGQTILVDGGLSLIWPETLARKLAGF